MIMHCLILLNSIHNYKLNDSCIYIRFNNLSLHGYYLKQKVIQLCESQLTLELNVNKMVEETY